MPVDVSLPDDLVKEIDAITDDRVAFIIHAVKRQLHDNFVRRATGDGGNDTPELQTLT
jgi:hypothetical protein